jgi:hypothetical protein
MINIKTHSRGMHFHLPTPSDGPCRPSPTSNFFTRLGREARSQQEEDRWEARSATTSLTSLSCMTPSSVQVMCPSSLHERWQELHDSQVRMGGTTNLARHMIV